MLCIFFASWTLMGLTAASAEPTTPQGWTLDPSVKISPESAAILRHRFPTIESPSDLSRILVSTSFKSPSSSLRAEMIGNKWIVKGSSASTIIAIDFVLAPLTMLQNLRTTASKWIGQVHTDELKNKVEADTTLFMHKSGYRNASTKIQIVESGNQIEYKATLNIGVPCVIRGYDWPERLPDIKVPILENGDTCDDAAAAASIDETEQKLRQSGWVQASLEFNGFRTDPEQTIAYVKVSGSIGDKITYSFIDPITKIDVSNQLTSSEIQSIDPRVTGPDAVSYELLHQLRERGYSDATCRYNLRQKTGYRP
ncbi:MAG: hypothetical protein NTV34_12840 [Proteobacteria bacterium]|nr:hypothetical protein [Pseudomonadota bacterium]